MSSACGHHRERGMILIAVLLAVAIMAVMVVATAALTRSGIGNEELEQRRLTTHLALRSGIEAAKAMILATPEDQRLLLNGAELPVDLGDGLMATVSLRDAAALADLNRSDPKMIETVAGGLGLEKAAEGLAEKIATLRKEREPKKDGQPPQKAGKPSPPLPQGLAPVSGTNDLAKAPPPPPIIFLSVGELAQLLEISPEEAMALNDGLTVYNPTGEINPFAAPDEVLQAIPGITDADIRFIASARKSGRGGSDPRMQQLVQRLAGMMTLKPPTVFMVEVKLTDGGAALPGSAAHAVVRLLPEGKGPFGTLALKED